METTPQKLSRAEEIKGAIQRGLGLIEVDPNSITIKITIQGIEDLLREFNTSFKEDTEIQKLWEQFQEIKK